MDNTEEARSFSIDKARKAQLLLTQKVIATDVLPEKIKLVAGVDAAYLGDLAFGAVAVLDYDSLEVLETQTSKATAGVPYVPTLLAFRELPVVLACVKKLKLYWVNLRLVLQRVV
jgi:deoxyribonuclease V